MDEREKIRFLRITDDLGAIDPGVTVQVNLTTIKNSFGNNLNTLIVTNNAAEELILSMDGIQVQHVKGNGTVFSWDWEAGLIFSELKVTNNDGATATDANEIRITVGRTGPGGV